MTTNTTSNPLLPYCRTTGAIPDDFIEHLDKHADDDSFTPLLLLTADGVPIVPLSCLSAAYTPAAHQHDALANETIASFSTVIIIILNSSNTLSNQQVQQPSVQNDSRQ